MEEGRLAEGVLKEPEETQKNKRLISSHLSLTLKSPSFDVVSKGGGFFYVKNSVCELMPIPGFVAKRLFLNKEYYC